MKRFALAALVVSIGCGRHEPPPPPPPAPPGVATTVATAPTPVPVTPVLAPVPSGAPVATVVPPPPTMPPMPTGSAICQRAAHCCTTAAAHAPRGIPRHGHSPRELLMAHDAQCAQAIGVCAEALMQMGEQPPTYCTQPGRHSAPRDQEW